MLTDKDLEFKYEGVPGEALTWIIDEDCLYDLPLKQEHALIFLDHDEVLDISDQYPDHNGITVRFIKNEEIVEELQTSEYFGSILLSNPKVVNLLYHKNGLYVGGTNAKFIDNKFIILSSIVPEDAGWLSKFDPGDLSVDSICTKMCGCGRIS